jgi:hypothetical protein
MKLVKMSERLGIVTETTTTSVLFGLHVNNSVSCSFVVPVRKEISVCCVAIKIVH